MGRALSHILVILLISGIFSPTRAKADVEAKEFIMSCTYGVMAGTLVGAASLAFTSKPGDNLNMVARGASIGLYTGILLGLYVLYIVPSMESDGEENPVARLDRIPVMVSPTLNFNNRIDGVKADWTVLKF